MAAAIEGLIVANTTTARDAVAGHAHAGETGGLSGPPLFARSTAMLAKVRRIVGRRLVLVGVGGVDSAETAFAKILAGADLVQLYTGMVYRGPGLARTIVDRPSGADEGQGLRRHRRRGRGRSRSVRRGRRVI